MVNMYIIIPIAQIVRSLVLIFLLKKQGTKKKPGFFLMLVTHCTLIVIASMELYKAITVLPLKKKLDNLINTLINQSIIS